MSRLWRLTSIAFAALAVAALAPASSTARSGEDQEMRACEDHLRRISAALQQYQRERGKLPDQLSDLVPQYLPDRSVLLCPSDPTGGTPGRDYAHKDPRLPCSYSYEFSADISNGLPTPLGKFPPPDVSSGIPGADWGTWRHVNSHQRTFFGDQVPVVRCFHHKPVEFDEAKVLNLTLSGKIYASDVEWEKDPDSVANVAVNLARDLKLGAARFQDRWYIGRLQEWSYGWESDPRLRARRPQLVAGAEALEGAAKDFPLAEQRLVHQVAARFLIAAGEYRRGISAVEAARRVASQDRDAPEREGILLADAYRGLGDRRREISILLGLFQKNHAHYFMGRLAEAYEALGDSRKAEEWRLKDDPGRGLVGKVAPGFQLPLAIGGDQSLADALHSKKAVLVNFWFYG